METKKRVQRTPEQIIAETEARLERLRIRQAKSEAKTNPEVADLMEQRADLTKKIREAKKLLGEGPQSARARITKHESWISKINLESLIAEDTLKEAADKLESVDSEIAKAIHEIVASK